MEVSDLARLILTYPNRLLLISRLLRSVLVIGHCIYMHLEGSEDVLECSLFSETARDKRQKHCRINQTRIVDEKSFQSSLTRMNQV